MNQTLSIGFAEETDYDQWRPLWDAYNAFYGRADAKALLPDITAITWARFLDPGEPMHALIAKEQCRVIGIAHYLFHRSTTSLTPNCYLQDLYTCEDQRGRGIGRALIDSVSLRARDEGSSGIYWQTHKTNEIAMRLYDKVAEQSEFLIYRKTVPVGLRIQASLMANEQMEIL